jgi:hypothetical protein
MTEHKREVLKEIRGTAETEEEKDKAKGGTATVESL